LPFPEDEDDRAAAKRRVVKRKRKSFRNDDDDENSDSEDENSHPSVRLRGSSKQHHDDGILDLDDVQEQLKATKTTNEDPEPADEEAFIDDNDGDDEPKELQFTKLYTGSGRTFDARSLEPATTYLFRLCAVNSAGASEWSEPSEASTPPAAPAVVSEVNLKDSSATSLRLTWTRPQSNGEHITHYNVDTGSSVLPTPGPDTYFVLDSLKPDTSYSIRVQAVNCVGPGHFSSTARLHTRPLPPAPPRVECVNANHNSLKLKWGDTKSSSLSALSDPCQYTLEMENSRNQFQVVYAGASVSHKIPKLIENKTYRIRMCASNAAGHGPYSQVFEFKTAYAHPPPVKIAPRVNVVSEDGCLVEWTPLKQAPGQGELLYKVSLTKVRDNEAKIIYSGSDTQFRASSLDPKTEYTIRVCGVRVPVAGVELAGTNSPPAVFSTLQFADGHGPSRSGSSSSAKGIATSRSGLLPQRGDRTWTDKQWAFVIAVGFTLFALTVSVIMQQII
jgi:hypothetical protein